MNPMLMQQMGMLDPYGMRGGEFQQNPNQLLTDNYGPPQNPMAVNDAQQPAMLNPQMAAYGAALTNIGDILGNRAPRSNISSAYIMAKNSNDNARRTFQMTERQKDQDDLNKRYKESQISKLDAEALAKGSGGFQGTGIEAQMLNKYLNRLPPEERALAEAELVRQRLERERTTVTPEGTYTQPGYSLPPQQPVGGQAVTPPIGAQDIPAFTPKPLTGEQAKASGFYDRMTSSQGEIDRILTEYPDFDPSGAAETVAGMIPGVGNMLISPEKQQYNQAAKDWIRAKLRRESGAVIGEEEAAEEYRTYFPMPGDSKEVIAQKSRARKTAETAMREASGPQKSVSKINKSRLEELRAKNAIK